MFRGLLVFFVCISFCVNDLRAQTCKELGQNPGTAFPVCGVETFRQNQVKICGNKAIPGSCSSEGITDKNPYWYKFTCYTGGTLGFLITPLNLNDDYDWELFDITDRKPEDVYKNKDLFVACNWSGEVGKTGASSAGTSVTVCTGKGKALFSAMPTLQVGHEYLLLISHFTDSQSGYDLEFKGGTADITDPKIPEMVLATANCEGTEVRIKLNKKMQCTSLAADGSDFFLPSGLANIVSAVSPKCSDGFELDSIVLQLDKSLPQGDYAINLRQGTDANTLLDICGMNMPGGSINFTVHENVSASFNYQVNEGCMNDTVNFIHDGAHSVNKWLWEFDDNSTGINQTAKKIYVNGGNRNVRLTVANNYCSDTYEATIPLSEKIRLSFKVPEIVCATDKVAFTDQSTGNVSQWLWEFGNGATSTEKDPIPFNYPKSPGETKYIVKLNVKNDQGCEASGSANITVVGNCFILVPTAFTPNNDGKNDFLYPTNGFATDNLVFRVFNRYGQLVFESKDWRKKWDGTLQGKPQLPGTYVWLLNYTLRSTGKMYTFKGTTVLIR